MLEMVKALREVSGIEAPYEVSGRREGDPAVLVASSGKAKRILHWEAKHSGIHEILRDAWNWENHRRY